MHNPRICLCMIVKNEEKVLARALQSVRGLIDYWVICDTGSTDATPAVVLDNLNGIPGELHRVEWVNFGHNRTQVLEMARDKADYLLIIDADMIVRVQGDFKHKLHLDYYEIRYEGPLDYTQPMLLSGHHHWQYVGVTHEYLYAETAQTWDFLPELSLLHLADGGMRADKFERDIQLLTDALEQTPGDLRNMFYLAQSYRDLGRPHEALHWYRARVAGGIGWQEEHWYAQYQVGLMLQQSGAEWPFVLEAFLEAHAARPWRLEPVYQIIKHYRETENYRLGYCFFDQMVRQVQYPATDRLFIEKPVYEYLMALEHGVCACGIGRTAESLSSFEHILQFNPTPDWVRESAERGRELAHSFLYSNTTTTEPCIPAT